MAKKKKVFRATRTIRDFVITEVSGEDTLDIVNYLKGKENVSEFVIAKDLEQEINAIRNKLYRLLQANLISFTRKKDKQKGWYIYYWTLNLSNIKFLYFDIKRKRLDKLKERVEREKNNVFFSGPSQAIRLDFEQAMQFDFKCPETGELLEQEDNSKTIKELEQEIKQLEKEVKELQQ
jgi:transcription initiation factor TFIIE subunit alpha